jgi:hypothetical protein
VWVVGAVGDRRLHGYDGDTGAVICAGYGPNEQMTGTHKSNTVIVARGRTDVAASNKVYGLPFRERPRRPNRKGNPTNARIETADGICEH